MTSNEPPEHLQQEADTALRTRTRCRNLVVMFALGYIASGMAMDLPPLNTAQNWLIGLTINLGFAAATGITIGKYTAFVDIHRSRQTYADVAKSTTTSIAYQAMEVRYETDPIKQTEDAPHVLIDGLFNKQLQQLDVWERYPATTPGFKATIDMSIKLGDESSSIVEPRIKFDGTEET